jgi:hypothetical protein
MAKSGAQRNLITPTFRMSFPKLITPEPYMENGKPKGEPVFQCEMLFAPEDIVKFQGPAGLGLNGTAHPKIPNWETGVDLKRVCALVAKETWPDITSIQEAVAARALHWPIVNGDQHFAKKEAKAKATGKKVGGEYYKGTTFLRTKTGKEFPPQLYYPEGGKKLRLNIALDSDKVKAEGLFKGGNYAFAEITVKGTESAQGRFISMYVNSVCFVKQGEGFGGARLMERFDGINGGESDHNPLDGLDGLDEFDVAA